MLEACLVDDEEAGDILERDWSGLCYAAALRWVTDAEDFDWTVVHGTVWSEKEGRRIDHAWCERGETVVDLVIPIPVGLRIIERYRYYRIEEFHREITGRGYKYLRPGIETTFYDSKSVEATDPTGMVWTRFEDVDPEAPRRAG
ncbi:MAG: hypothetical protein LC104_21820 [Bacteroidales bacterium]|nr:hypothetical protein [Bacteroidales bacterium]